MELDPQDTRRRAFKALKEVLLRLSDAAPVVIAIDDLQWGDEDSGLLLQDLLAPPDAPRLLLIGSYRSDEAKQSPLLRVLRDDMERAGAEWNAIVLAQLTREESRALALAVLGEDDESRAATIADEGNGSPFFISELARARQRTGDRATTVAELVMQRVAGLPDDARRLLELLSLAAGPVPKNAALHAANLAPAEDAVVPLLRSASLVRTGSAGLETYHDRIRETVAASLSKDALVAHHGALADALADLPEPPTEALARHYAEAQRPAEACKYAVQAAKRAFDALAFDQAAHHYTTAVALTKDVDARRDLEERLGDALASAGRGAEAAEVYMRAAANADEARAIELDRRATFELVTSGQLARGFSMADRIVARVGLWVPKRRSVQYLIGLLCILYLFVRGVPKRLRSASDVDSEELRRIDVGQSLATALVMVDSMRMLGLTGMSLLHALRAREPRRIAISLMHVCWLTGGFLYGRPDKWLAELRRIANDLDDPKLRACAALSSGLFSYARGHWEVAFAELEDADARCSQCSGVAVEGHYARTLAIYSLCYLGRFRELSERTRAVAMEARARGNRWAHASLVSAAGVLAWLGDDDVATAERNIEEGASTLRGFAFQEYWYAIARILALLYKGEHVACLDLIEKFWPTLEGTGLLRIHIIRSQLVYFRSAASIATARTDEQRAPSLLKKASSLASVLRRVPMDGVAGHADVIDAAIAFAKNDKAKAISLLRSANEDLTRTKTFAFAAAARHYLGKLVGGEEGDAIVAEANAFFAKEGVVRPERFARMLAAGFE